MAGSRALYRYSEMWAIADNKFAYAYKRRKTASLRAVA